MNSWCIMLRTEWKRQEVKALIVEKHLEVRIDG